MYKDQACNEAVNRYRSRFEEHKVSSKTLGWREGTQDIRFAAFFAGLPPLAQSVMDIGCGFGDLLPFLRQRGWRGHYIGMDIVPEFIATAQKKYEDDNNSSFLCADFMENNPVDSVDVTFSSGVFNYYRDNNIMYLRDSVIKAKEITRLYTAFDMLSATADRRADHLFFFDSAQLLTMGLSMTHRCVIDHSYMPFEFMMKLYWEQSFKSDWPVFAAFSP